MAYGGCAVYNMNDLLLLIVACSEIGEGGTRSCARQPNESTVLHHTRPALRSNVAGPTCVPIASGPFRILKDRCREHRHTNALVVLFRFSGS
jgi:hypothetical protein